MKKKILFITDSLNGGGAEKVLLTYLKNIDNSLFAVDLFLINKVGIYIEDLPSYVHLKWGFKEPLGLFGRIIRRIFLRYPFWFYLFFIRKKYDVEVAFREDCSTRIVLSSFNRKSKKISWLHTDLTRYVFYPTTPVKSYIRNLSKLNHIVCVSHGVESILHKLNPFTVGKTSVLYNPIDSITILNQSMLPFDDPFDYSKINLLTIGRIDKGKNHRFLINCMPILLQENKDIHLWILGVGEEMEVLKKYCEDLNVTDNVHFLGFVKNPFPYLRHADLFVFSSKFEGLPTVLIEALILQKKIVSSYCIGAEEVLEYGKYGILTNLNEEEYSKKVLEMIEGYTLENIPFNSRVKDFELKTQCSLFNNFLDA